MRLAVSVVTWRQAPIAQAGEGLLALEALADEAQDGHLALCPLDAADAFVREAEVGDVVGGGVAALVIGSIACQAPDGC